MTFQAFFSFDLELRKQLPGQALLLLQVRLQKARGANQMEKVKEKLKVKEKFSGLPMLRLKMANGVSFACVFRPGNVRSQRTNASFTMPVLTR